MSAPSDLLSDSYQSVACSDRARDFKWDTSASLGWIKPRSFGVVPGTFLSHSSMKL